MKRTTLKFTKGKLFSAVTLASAIFLAQPANAKNSRIHPDFNEDSAFATVIYLGSAKDGLLVDFAVTNPKGSRFTLFIQDDNGSVLYSNNYTVFNLSKKFKLLKNSDDSRYNFVIDFKNEAEQKIAVYTTQKTTEEVEITEL